LNGATWTIVIFGLNQDTIAAGTLLTAQMRIAPGAAAGDLKGTRLNSGYVAPDGISISPGTSTGGSITVTSPPPPPAPAITSASTATATTGTAFSYQITATNSPTSFDATGLSAGLMVNTATGLISGTPTSSGTFSVALSATNSGGTGTKTLSLTINPRKPVITSAGTATGQAGTVVDLPISFDPGTD